MLINGFILSIELLEDKTFAILSFNALSCTNHRGLVYLILCYFLFLIFSCN
jgi:hypothetical protein